MSPFSQSSEYEHSVSSEKSKNSRYTLLEIIGIAGVLGGILLYLIVIHNNLSDVKGDIKALNVHISHILKALE